MKQIVFYSCITGQYDRFTKSLPSSQISPEEGVQYVLYTDQPEAAKRALPGDTCWDVRPLAWQHALCRRRTARWHKVNSHLLFPREETVTIWADGSQKLKTRDDTATSLASFVKQAPIATFRHPERTCVYQELSACCRLKKDNPLLMRRQVQAYREQGYPPYHGLVETSCVVRRHTPEVQEFNTLWWEEIHKNSLRDQLSFNYVAWRLGVKYGIIPGCRTKSQWFHYVHHASG